MIPRRGRTLPALIVAAIVAAGGVTVAIDVIAVLAGSHPLIWPQRGMASQMRATHWNDIPILAIAAAIAFVGLLLLVAGLTPGKRRLVEFTVDDETVTAGISRSSLRKAIREAALDVDGIDRAKVKVNARRAKVAASSGMRESAGLREHVSAAVAERLEGIGLVTPINVHTKIVYKEGG